MDPQSPRSPRYSRYSQRSPQAYRQYASPVPSPNPIGDLATNLGQGLNEAITSITQSVNTIFGGAQNITNNVARNTQQTLSSLNNLSPRSYSNYRYPTSRDPFTTGPQGYIGGPIKYNQTTDFGVARRDPRDLGLGTGGYGGEAGGYGGYGGGIALTSRYPQPNRHLIDQGTTQALPNSQVRSGMYGRRQSGPQIRPEEIPELDDESTLGTYDIGLPAYSTLNNRTDSYGPRFTNRYGENY